MTKIASTTALCAMLLALGCDDGRGGGRDAGGIVLMDSGPGGGTDAGPGMMGGDSGPGDSCPPAEAAAPDPTMVCAASTLTCLMGATTADAQQACISADPMADACDLCIFQDQLFTCSSAMGGGCDDEYGEFECCLADQCGGMTGAALEMCIGTAIGTMAAPGPCAADFSTFATCANTASMARRCGITMACFMGGGGGFLPDLGRRQPLPHRSWEALMSRYHR